MVEGWLGDGCGTVGGQFGDSLGRVVGQPSAVGEQFGNSCEIVWGKSGGCLGFGRGGFVFGDCLGVVRGVFRDCLGVGDEGGVVVGDLRRAPASQGSLPLGAPNGHS